MKYTKYSNSVAQLGQEELRRRVVDANHAKKGYKKFS